LKLEEKKAEKREKKAERRERKAERNAEKKVELSEKKERQRERSRKRKLKMKEAEEHMVKKLKERAAKFVDPARPKKPLVPYMLYVTPYVERSKKNFEAHREAAAAFDAANPIPKRPPTVFSSFVKQQFAAHPEAKSLEGARGVVAAASKEWKSLPNQEKEKLKKEYQTKLAAYRANLARWTESQIDKLPQSEREFAREALKSGRFNKPREVQLLVSDLSKIANVKGGEAANA